MRSHLTTERVKRALWQDAEIYTYLLPVDVNIQHVCPFDSQTSSNSRLFMWTFDVYHHTLGTLCEMTASYANTDANYSCGREELYGSVMVFSEMIWSPYDWRRQIKDLQWNMFLSNSYPRRFSLNQPFSLSIQSGKISCEWNKIYFIKSSCSWQVRNKTHSKFLWMKWS